MTLALYGKSKRRQGGLILAGLLAVVVMAFAAMVAARDARAVSITLDDVDGEWQNAVGATTAITSSADITIARWGTEQDNNCIQPNTTAATLLGGSSDDRSGYVFDSVDTQQTFNDGVVIPLGNFTHVNCPISAGTSITSIQLSLTLYFSAPAVKKLTLPFTFEHDETPNNASPCAYPEGPNQNGCADRVLVSGAPSDEFQIGDDLYKLQFVGFASSQSPFATNCPATPTTTPGLAFLTAEGGLSSACLYAKIVYSRPVVEIIKTPDNGTVQAGNDIEFTVVVKNNGDAPATNVSFNDPLPGPFTWTESPDKSECSIVGGTLSCTIPTLAAGAEFSVTVKAPTTTSQCGQYDNTARLTTHGESEDSGRVTVENCTRTIVVAKSAAGDGAPSTEFSYTIQPVGISDKIGPMTTGVQYNTHSGIASMEQTVTETNTVPPAGWTLMGYTVNPGLPGENGPNCSGDLQPTAAVPATGDYTVCIHNRYTPPPPQTRNLQICKIVVGNGDLVIRSGGFNFGVRENGETVIDGLPGGAINASEPNPDTNGSNGIGNCKTVQVATDKTISVFEWGSRPAGWGGDATGYPKYSINGGAPVANDTTSNIAAGTSDIEVTFYNKETLPTVNVTFSKYICNSLGDIARNQEGVADDDVGKPSMSPTGGLSAQLGPVGSLGNDEAVTPANDGRNQANCHLWGSDLVNYPEETGTWGMEVYTTNRANLLMSINIPGNGVPGAGSISVPLTEAALLETLAPNSSGARVEEVFKTGYGFGSLKCYTDHLHQDNWEWLDFNPGGIPQGEVHCIAYNVKAEKEIKIEKLFIGEFTEADYPTFTLDPVPAGFNFATDCSVAVAGQKVTWTCKVPYDWNGTITETPKPGWQEITNPTCRDLFAEQVQGGATSQYFFCNQAVGTVVIIKFENVNPSTPQNWTFTGTLPGAPFAAQTTGSSNSTDVVSQTVNNVPAGNYTLSEAEGRAACGTGTTSNDWQTHGLVKLDIAQEGPPTASDLNALPPIGTGTLGFAVLKNTVTYVAFGNRGCGTVLSSQQLQVIKYSDPLANFTGNTPLSDWEITITGTAGAATGFVTTENTNGAAGALFFGIPDGTYTVCETPKANWNVVGSRYNAVNQAGSCRAGVVVNLDQTIVVNFYNQPRVNITVNKVIFNNANPQGANGGSGWTFTLSGCGIVPSAQTTGASGSVSWTDLPPAVNCTYTVTETAKAGWIADQISQNTSPTQAGQTASLTFNNRQFQGCVNINDCPPPTTSTPTSTPTTPPTSTPVPGETPTTPPDETPAASPTTEETVEGERTPGPGQPTPIAPSTGGGFGGQHAAGINLLLLLAGLIAISGGLSFIALGRRETTRR